ncbi:MAG TPA: hypothetical protein VHJ17_07100 [Thermomonospora sp.]|nr:hypothetical protein [Thermomonospora sp.]
MADVCRFVPFSARRRWVQEIAPQARYLKPEFVQELSESCEVEEV